MTKITPELLEKFEFKVPRYTSYPTAPHFSPEVGSDTYVDWLKNQNPNEPISLYIHVPYCDTLCWFCACNTQITSNYRRIESYLKWLTEEAKLLHQYLGFKPKIARLHWGGGSPTLLQEDDWKMMGDLVHQYFDFTDDAELSVELDPRDIQRSYTQTLFDVGINRASIGVQDFEEDVQKAINRLQPFEVVEEVVLGLRDVGIEDINLDIMYGLPYQTEERTIAMSEKCLKLKPKRVALFGYAHVPWMKPHQNKIPEGELPGSWERYQQFKLIEDILSKNGLDAIGLDHFAVKEDSLHIAQREGRMRRNFQGYTTDTATTLIGLGPSSIGSMHQGYVQNQASISMWKSELKQGFLPVHKGLKLTDDDRMRRAIIEELMCNFSVDLDKVLAEYGHKDFILDSELDALKLLENEELVHVDGHKISVEVEHRLFLRAAAAVFDVYLNKGKAKHSRAI
ncbi:MAG: oxygen-independent coproporphyrinogen III oxidase [Alphaproteobacteria bacterium]